MSTASARGFTLIEVIGAVFAFVIAFLAGSATFARLLQQQNLNYQRTLAASAAMLLVDWHADHAAGDFEQNTVSAADAPLRAVSPAGAVDFRGGDRQASDALYAFRATAGTAGSVDLSLYGSLVVALSQPSPQESDAHLVWRQLSFYYGSLKAVEGPGRASLDFVGRYLVPDRAIP